MKKLKNKKAGGSSIILVLIIITTMSFAQGFIDNMSYTYSMKKIQTTMDQTAVSSLTIPGAVIRTNLLQEEFIVQKNVIENYFRSEFNSLMNENKNPRIKNVQVRNVKIHVVNRHDDDKGNWGFPDFKQRDFVVIESVVVVTVRDSGIAKIQKSFRRNFFNSFTSSNFSVSENMGSNESVIILRTMSKGTFY